VEIIPTSAIQFGSYAALKAAAMRAGGGQGLTVVHFQLNVSTFCWIRWVHDFPPVY